MLARVVGVGNFGLADLGLGWPRPRRVLTAVLVVSSFALAACNSNGLGVPQSYDAAASLYIGAAERGDPTGQHLLGLMYDKGHGVERDVVEAYKWLSLAAAAAPPREREPYLRIRDAVASKMSLAEVMRASGSRSIGGKGREAGANCPRGSFFPYLSNSFVVIARLDRAIQYAAAFPLKH